RGAFSANNLTVFVGSGPYKNTDGSLNPSAIGVLLNNASVAYMAPTSGPNSGSGLYGLYATGTLSLVGLNGLTVTATVTLKINTTGASLSITDPANSANAIAIGASSFSLAATHVDLNAGGVFDVSGALKIARSASGTLYLALTGATVSINVNGSPVFSIGGSATFTIDPVSGFHMQSFSVSDFALLGIDAGLSGSPSGGSALAPT